MIYYLGTGVLFGVAAGFAPGPLLALVITETLRHGVGAGVRVALAPVITDFPIIVIVLAVLTQLPDNEFILGIISLVGGCYVLYLAYESAWPRVQALDQLESKPRSLVRGVIANALSPHPYLFWMTVGAPMIIKSYGIGLSASALFLGGFYLCLVGSKVVLAVLVGKSKFLLTDNGYRYSMRFLGLALAVFAVALFTDGLRLLANTGA